MKLEEIAKQKYLSPEEKNYVEDLYAKILSHESLRELTNPQTLREVNKKRKEIEAHKGKMMYDTSEETLDFNALLFWPSLFAGFGHATFLDPEKIKKRIEELKNYKDVKELPSLIDKLKAIYRNTSREYNNLEFNHKVKVRKFNLGYLISDLEKNPDRVLVSEKLVSEVYRVYGIVESYEKAKTEEIKRYEGVIEEESIPKLEQGNFYDVSAYSKNREDPKGELIKTFSKKHGGVGYLKWSREKGWCAEKISKRMLKNLATTVKNLGKIGVRLKITKVYVNNL